jgi:hypothetical protein
MSYTDPTTGQVLAGTAADDTASSDMSYQFDGHQPDSMCLESGDPDIPLNPEPFWVSTDASNTPNSAFSFGGWCYLYELLDTEGNPMPGVWVNECFFWPISPPPYGFEANLAGQGWETIWGYPCDTTPAFDSVATWGAGYFDAADAVSGEAPPGSQDYDNVMHYYDAGTMAIDGSGIRVGTATSHWDWGASAGPTADVGQSGI